VELLREAKAPLIYAGGGVISANAHEDLIWLARTLRIPVTATLMGLGAFPSQDPLWLGMLGMHGTYAANMAVNNCDLLLAIGARFDDRVTGKISAFAAKAKVVHIDIDPTSIQKNVSVDVPMVAGCREALKGLRSELEKRAEGKDWDKEHAEWIAQVNTWSMSHPVCYTCSSERLKPQEVIEKIHEISRGEAIISTEVGQNQMWTAQFYRFARPRSLLTSGGLGTMGYGFPAAIGAQLAFPGSLVIDIAGDGSIQMNIQELATAVSYELPVKVVILNNGYLGMVRQWQELFYQKNYCSTCLHKNPDFVAVARAYGAEGYRITTAEELREILPTALSSKKPAFIDVWVEPEENVYPMVPAGASLTEMLLV
jgi:acetolactate synthase I/II/III large subunit